MHRISCSTRDQREDARDSYISRDKNNLRDPCSFATIRFTLKDTLAFRSIGYVNVASRGCDECNREYPPRHRGSAELALAKPNDAFRCYRDQGTVARNCEKSRRRRRDAARRIGSSHRSSRPVIEQIESRLPTDDIHADQ